VTDHLNRVRDIAKYDPGSEMTTVVNHLTYDAFGQVTSESNPAIDSLFLFTGGPFDSWTSGPTAGPSEAVFPREGVSEKSEGRACRARGSGMDHQSVFIGPDERVPSRDVPARRVFRKFGGARLSWPVSPGHGASPSW